MCELADHLITLYKTSTGYQESERSEKSITRHFQILSTTVSSTFRPDLIQRLKQIFDNILHAIIDGFRYQSGGHQAAVDCKPFVQKTFDLTVDFTISIESRLLLDKKQDLLSDIHTQLTNAITSKMLKYQLLPTFKFKSQFILDEMVRKHDPENASQTDSALVKARSTLEKAELDKLSTILERVSTQFDIQIPDILRMLQQKRKRNAEKHYDSRIQEHVRTHRGRSKQFESFLESEGLLRAFNQNEIQQTQRMYVDHCQISAVDWHTR